MGRRLGARGIPSVLCLLEFKTVDEMDKVTSPLRSKEREEASREVILKLTQDLVQRLKTKTIKNKTLFSLIKNMQELYSVSLGVK